MLLDHRGLQNGAWAWTECDRQAGRQAGGIPRELSLWYFHGLGNGSIERSQEHNRVWVGGHGKDDSIRHWEAEKAKTLIGLGITTILFCRYCSLLKKHLGSIRDYKRISPLIDARLKRSWLIVSVGWYIL